MAGWIKDIILGTCDFSDFSVSPLSKSFFFPFLGGILFNLGVCWDNGLDSVFGPVLDNKEMEKLTLQR